LDFVREFNAQDQLLHRIVRVQFQKRLDSLSPEQSATLGRYLELFERFRAATHGDPRRSLRLDESAVDPEAIRSFEFVFGRPPRSTAPEVAIATTSSDVISVVVAGEGRHLLDTVRDP